MVITEDLQESSYTAAISATTDVNGKPDIIGTLLTGRGGFKATV